MVKSALNTSNVKSALCLLVSLILVLFSSCSTPEWDRLENFNGQLSIDYPTGWEFEDMSEGGDLFLGFTKYDGDKLVTKTTVTVTNETYFETRDYWLDDIELKETAVSIDNKSLRQNFLYSVFVGKNNIYNYFSVIAWINENQTAWVTTLIPLDDGYEAKEIIAACVYMLDSIQIQ
jgi:hypothetical protein